MTDASQPIECIVVDGHCLFGFSVQEGVPLLNLDLRDYRNRQLLAVDEGCLSAKSDAWDVEMKGAVITVRTGRGKVRLQCEFVPPHEVRIHRGTFMFNGIAFECDAQGLCLLNTGQRICGGGTLAGFGCMIAAGDLQHCRGGALFAFPPCQRRVFSDR
jgi:hypothetical protein